MKPSQLVPSLVLVLISIVTAGNDIPYFIKQCHRNDLELDKCLTDAGNFLTMNFRKGIPELLVENAEPIFIDQISLALGDGPDGYKATFKDIQAFGVSNLTVVAVRSRLNENRFQMRIYVPRIEATANYLSSGVLIMIQSSGGGDYWGVYEGVKAVIDFDGTLSMHQGKTYMEIRNITMDFTVDDITMGIENIHSGNQIIQAAMNLFINTNAQELLTAMKPDVTMKLTTIMRNFMDKLMREIPYDTLISDP